MTKLYYQGKPYVGYNRQADKLPDLCFCRFIGVGLPLDHRQCKVHDKERYRCEEQGCTCSDDKPNKIKLSPGHWPLCTCSHIAQMHN